MTVATEKAGGGNGGGGGLAIAAGARAKTREEKIYVTVRVRPLSNKELARSDTSDWECTNDNTISSKVPVPERSPYPSSYTFGKAFLALLSFYPPTVGECYLSFFAVGSHMCGNSFPILSVVEGFPHGLLTC
jgi:hypothetical protein